MNITREYVDEWNAVVKISISKDDYTQKVDAVLNDYRRKAHIPGFRKGHVPMGLVKKQYGKAVLVDEVNRLLQDSLHKYLTEEKLDVLGSPLPKMQQHLDWEAQDFSFEFELGLVPDFKVNLEFKKPITYYEITADAKMVDEHVTNLRKQYGKVSPRERIEKNSEIVGTFTNEENQIHHKTVLTLDRVKGKKNVEKFIDAKVGDVLTFVTEGLFEDEHDLMNALGVSHEQVHDLEVEVHFAVEGIYQREPAALDQAFFDKFFEKDEITSEEAFRDRVKEDSEKQFLHQADQQLLSDVTNYLLEHTTFNLPSGFLKRLIQTTGENPLNEEDAAEEYKKSEKALRYQLIENKIVKENKIALTYDDLKEFAKNFVITQMAQMGNHSPSEADVEHVTSRILANQEQVKRLSEQLTGTKLINLYKAKVPLKTKKVSYEEFVKAVYK